MLRCFATLALAVLAAPLIVMAHEQEPSADPVVHGTINIALGNKNGIVVLTDSMLTRDGHQLAERGQKLFKLDDRTVCAIAGFVSADAPVPDLNTNTSAIIHEYIRQSAGQPPQTFRARLGVLSTLFRLHLEMISNVRSAVGRAVRIDNYRLQIIVAGYDLDNMPKIGRITFGLKEYEGALVAETEEASVVIVEEKLIWKLNGMPDRAEALLLNPELGPNEGALLQYKASQHENGGSSLTIEQMVKLAKQLAFFTSKAHPEVGGPNQIATLKPHEPVNIEQQAFPVPPKPLTKFSLSVMNKITGGKFSNLKGIGFLPGVAGIFVGCEWRDARQTLDGNYFIENTFTNSVLVYGGAGDLNFDKSNRVINSVLIVEPLVDLRSEALKRIAKAFQWSNMLIDLPRGSL